VPLAAMPEEEEEGEIEIEEEEVPLAEFEEEEEEELDIEIEIEVPLSEMPQTNVISATSAWIVGLFGSLFGFAGLTVISRKKK